VPTLFAPLALIGLAALPALAAIYWLRNRYRRQTVSSLMLWSQLAEAREGGTRFQQFRVPLLFLLELLALLMLVLAAAGPRMLMTSTRLPLVIVLDDSYSMQASGPGDQPARRQAIDAIGDLLDGGHYKVQYVLARDEPQVLADATGDMDRAINQLEAWRCDAPSADLEQAVTLAGQVGGEHARIFVVTDREPATQPESGRIQWAAYGKDRPNVAIVNAARSSELDTHRVLLEVANLAAQPVRAAVTLTLAGDDQAPPIHRADIQLDPDQTRSLFIDIPRNAPALRATIGNDELTIDNTVTLQPVTSPSIRVALAIDDPLLRQRVRKAMGAIPNVQLAATDAQLVITDAAAGRTTEPQRWTMRLIREDPAKAYLGPFVVDRAHPLTDGLMLTGVIWAAGQSEPLPGRPIITAGNVVLLSDVEYPAGRHEVHLRLRPDLSSLLDSPNWPILMWNLATWRSKHAPGLDQTNGRVGDEIRLTVAPEVKTVNVTDPEGETRTLNVTDDAVTLPAELAGDYRLTAGKGVYTFSANVLDRNESNLSTRSAGQWGDWTESPTFRWEYSSLAWLFGLLAAACLTAHLYFVSRSARQGRRSL